MKEHKRSSQEQASSRSEEDSIQSQAPAPPRSLTDVPLQQERESSTGVPDAMLSQAEQLGGKDLSDVRVKYDSPEPEQVGAAAFAQGTDIHLGPGQESSLPHELWHTVQQKQGRVEATGSVAGRPLNDDKALETEADQMGDRIQGDGS